MGREVWKLIRGGFETAGAVQILLSLGLSSLLGAVVAGVLDLPWPLRGVIFLAAGLIALAGSMAIYRAILNKKAADQEAPIADRIPIPGAKRRVGIDNRGGGKSISKRPIFGSDLDVAIDNREGGESKDEDSTFL
jgi:hypothetical protein